MTVRILVTHDGVGWRIASPGRDLDAGNRPRPYSQREEAISDALFAARMLRALGEPASVYVENSDGLRLVAEEDVHVWRRH
ncbi:MAG: hypothetical protein J0I99_03000 [Devosia sp.]|uniref:hypothetical protein n=1 Tax=Devosia sp. TaxID=1871048 RepID=UPI001AD0448C|nr:hypothetical protein [Devosia sp.]MBN9314682.1 hypothetical protein [Devosia sp.]